ncbi:hypothetical protein [Lonepinella sp. BR2474]|uniref:hypothetical protein n=1 Tax=Lonepinella sp. BR2474 TaxID=3434548 RepID=UPI003F6E1306
MKDHLTEEKELLILKGDALRMKLLAQSQHTQHHIAYPLAQIKHVSSTLAQPAMRALFLSLLNRKLLSVKGLTYSALGLGAIYLLNNKNK